MAILDSIVVSIPACHAGDRGSIPRRGDYFLDKNLRFLVHGHSQNLRKKSETSLLRQATDVFKTENDRMH